MSDGGALCFLFDGHLTVSINVILCFDGQSEEVYKVIHRSVRFGCSGFRQISPRIHFYQKTQSSRGIDMRGEERRKERDFPQSFEPKSKTEVIKVRYSGGIRPTYQQALKTVLRLLSDGVHVVRTNNKVFYLSEIPYLFFKSEFQSILTKFYND